MHWTFNILIVFQSIVFFLQVGINPGLFAAFKGRHYAGPGNHLCKLLVKNR